MQNHLIIGLGGTGGKIIREFRKSVYEQYRPNDPPGVQLGYLYVDSDSSAMGATDKDWRTLGHNVQLPKKSQLEIGSANLSAILANLNAHPGVKSWIGDKTFWSGVLTTQAGATVLGGQKRRLGRFLFSQRVTEYMELVNELATDLQNRGLKGVTFHVCCGLAGGTGSGSVVDAIAQMRAKYEDSHAYPIFIYALLPDQTPPTKWDTGNYHANGYAALTELNALHVGAFQPHDISGGSKERRLRITDPFNICYVFSNQNEQNTFINVETEVPATMASFLSAAILTAPQEQLDGFRKVVTAENLTDRIVPEPGPDGTGAERSRKFGIFGIKRLVYPEEEIREYLTYSFARQAAMQLMTNNWRALVGYVEEPEPTDSTEYVRKPETQARWKFSVDHLLLSEGILEGEIADPKWKPIAAFWQTMAPQLLMGVTANAATRTKWMPELENRMAELFEKGYRSQGVPAFYRGKLGATREHADEIVRTIERELLDKWFIGSRSLAEIAKLLAALRGVVQDLKTTLETLEEKDGLAVDRADALVNSNRAEWGNVGPASRFFNKDLNILNAQATVLQEKYIAQTRRQGYQFGAQLCAELAARIDGMANDVGAIRKVVDDALIQCTQKMAARCAQSEDYDLNKLVVTFYDTKAVRRIGTLMERDKDVQSRQAGAVRDAIKERVAAGNLATFAKIKARLHTDTLVELLQTSCLESAENAHAEITSAGSDKPRLLGVNVVDKLYQLFDADPDGLTKFVQKLVDRAGLYGTFDGSQVREDSPGLTPGLPRSEFAVLLPLSDDNSEFRKRLCGAFESAGKQIRVFESSRKNEITLVSVAAGFPLRFLSDVKYLRDRYDRRVADQERAKHEIHLEGDGTQHPGLYPPDAAAIQRVMLEYLLIGRAMDVVQVKPGAAGKPQLEHVLLDEYGKERERIKLGSDVFDALEKATVTTAFGLRNDIDERLKSREMRAADRRAPLRRAISECADQIRKALDDGDEEKRDKLNKAAQAAMTRLQVTA